MLLFEGMVNVKVRVLLLVMKVDWVLLLVLNIVVKVEGC